MMENEISFKIFKWSFYGDMLIFGRVQPMEH